MKVASWEMEDPAFFLEVDPHKELKISESQPLLLQILPSFKKMHLISPLT